MSTPNAPACDELIPAVAFTEGGATYGTSGAAWLDPPPPPNKLTNPEISGLNPNPNPSTLPSALPTDDAVDPALPPFDSEFAETASVFSSIVSICV